MVQCSDMSETCNVSVVILKLSETCCHNGYDVVNLNMLSFCSIAYIISMAIAFPKCANAASMLIV